MLQGIHHVAYRCHDARETVRFYQQMLGMDFQLAIAEDKVPSTGEPDPYMHVFLDAGQGNVLAFFELPASAKMDRDRNTPAWVQHIAFRVAGLEELAVCKARLEAAGIEVTGPVNHGIFQSVYFFDPNGHRLELAADTATADQMKQLHEVAEPMLEEWHQTRKAPRHAAWLHEAAAEPTPEGDG
ncbi:MAG: VOC family protein [Pseudomonadales bacterium]|nr:VOC family protein [Pseudomonadales bacterium]